MILLLGLALVFTLQYGSSLANSRLNPAYQQLHDTTNNEQQTVPESAASSEQSPWISGPSNQKYQFHIGKQSWLAAREKCLAQNSDLVTIKNDDELQWLLTHYKPQFPYLRERQVQIGLLLLESDQNGELVKKEREWRWVDGQLLDLNMLHWTQGEPYDHAKGKERCALLNINEARIDDVDCDLSAGRTHNYRFVCERSHQSHVEHEALNNPLWKKLEDILSFFGINSDEKSNHTTNGLAEEGYWDRVLAENDLAAKAKNSTELEKQRKIDNNAEAIQSELALKPAPIEQKKTEQREKEENTDQNQKKEEYNYQKKSEQKEESQHSKEKDQKGSEQIENKEQDQRKEAEPKSEQKEMKISELNENQKSEQKTPKEEEKRKPEKKEKQSEESKIEDQKISKPEENSENKERQKSEQNILERTPELKPEPEKENLSNMQKQASEQQKDQNSEQKSTNEEKKSEQTNQKHESIRKTEEGKRKDQIQIQEFKPEPVLVEAKGTGDKNLQIPNIIAEEENRPRRKGLLLNESSTLIAESTDNNSKEKIVDGHKTEKAIIKEEDVSHKQKSASSATSLLDNKVVPSAVTVATVSGEQPKQSSREGLEIVGKGGGIKFANDSKSGENTVVAASPQSSSLGTVAGTIASTVARQTLGTVVNSLTNSVVTGASGIGTEQQQQQKPNELTPTPEAKQQPIRDGDEFSLSQPPKMLATNATENAEKIVPISRGEEKPKEEPINTFDPLAAVADTLERSMMSKTQPESGKEEQPKKSDDDNSPAEVPSRIQHLERIITVVQQMMGLGGGGIDAGAAGRQPEIVLEQEKQKKAENPILLGKKPEKPDESVESSESEEPKKTENRKNQKEEKGNEILKEDKKEEKKSDEVKEKAKSEEKKPEEVKGEKNKAEEVKEMAKSEEKKPEEVKEEKKEPEEVKEEKKPEEGKEKEKIPEEVKDEKKKPEEMKVEKKPEEVKEEKKPEEVKEKLKPEEVKEEKKPEEVKKKEKIPETLREKEKTEEKEPEEAKEKEKPEEGKSEERTENVKGKINAEEKKPEEVKEKQKISEIVKEKEKPEEKPEKTKVKEKTEERKSEEERREEKKPEDPKEKEKNPEVKENEKPEEKKPEIEKEKPEERKSEVERREEKKPEVKENEKSKEKKPEMEKEKPEEKKPEIKKEKTEEKKPEIEEKPEEKKSKLVKETIKPDEKKPENAKEKEITDQKKSGEVVKESKNEQTKQSEADRSIETTNTSGKKTPTSHDYDTMLALEGDFEEAERETRTHPGINGGDLVKNIIMVNPEPEEEAGFEECAEEENDRKSDTDQAKRKVNAELEPIGAKNGNQNESRIAKNAEATGWNQSGNADKVYKPEYRGPNQSGNAKKMDPTGPNQSGNAETAGLTESRGQSPSGNTEWKEPPSQDQSGNAEKSDSTESRGQNNSGNAERKEPTGQNQSGNADKEMTIDTEIRHEFGNGTGETDHDNAKGESGNAIRNSDSLNESINGKKPSGSRIEKYGPKKPQSDTEELNKANIDGPARIPQRNLDISTSTISIRDGDEDLPPGPDATYKPFLPQQQKSVLIRDGDEIPEKIIDIPEDKINKPDRIIDSKPAEDWVLQQSHSAEKTDNDQMEKPTNSSNSLSTTTETNDVNGTPMVFPQLNFDLIRSGTVPPEVRRRQREDQVRVDNVYKLFNSKESVYDLIRRIHQAEARRMAVRQSIPGQEPAEPLDN